MPSPETLERFIALVSSNAHDRAIADFYAEDGFIQENQAPPRVGRAALVEGERKVMARAKVITSTLVGPPLVNGDLVVLRWRFHFEWKDGSVTDMEELAYQRWENERIAGETFFYDPAQREPKR